MLPEADTTEETTQTPDPQAQIKELTEKLANQAGQIQAMQTSQTTIQPAPPPPPPQPKVELKPPEFPELAEDETASELAVRMKQYEAQKDEYQTRKAQLDEIDRSTAASQKRHNDDIQYVNTFFSEHPDAQTPENVAKLHEEAIGEDGFLVRGKSGKPNLDRIWKAMKSEKEQAEAKTVSDAVSGKRSALKASSGPADADKLLERKYTNLADATKAAINFEIERMGRPEDLPVS